MSDKQTIVGKIKRVINSSEVHFNASGEFCFDYHCGENLNSIIRKICNLITTQTTQIQEIVFEYGIIKIIMQNGDEYESNNLDIRYYTKEEIDELLSELSSSFLGLTDTPDTYVDQGGKLVAVNSSEDGLEFIEPPQGFSGDYNDLTNKPSFTGREGVKVTNPQNNDFIFETEFTSDLDDSLVTLAVGGIPSTTIGALEGQSIRKIIEDLLAPTLNPTLTNPDNTFTKTGGTTFETGSSQTFSFTSVLSRGSINPQYSASSPFRSGVAIAHTYTGTGLTPTVTTSNLSNTQSNITVTIANGNNIWGNQIVYDAGVQPFNNKGAAFSTPLPLGTTSNKTITVTGIYPFFYYKSSSPITTASMKTAIENGTATKVVSSSTGTISITFGASGQYLAFAYPSSSSTKTIWYVNALNNGSIGGGTNLFSSVSTSNIDSPNSFWTNINYKIHVSNFATSTTGVMELRNS